MGDSEKSTAVGPRPVLLNDQHLFSEVVSVDRLLGAWGRVLTNAGAAGGDGIGVQSFAKDAPRRIARLAQALSAGDYHPGPIRRVQVPKASGGVRTLAIPCVVDRIAQTSVHLTLGPLIDTEFEATSFAYRPGRGVRDAVRKVDALRGEGFAWLLDADIEGFFDNVLHERLLTRLSETLTDGPVTSLISHWLTHASPSGKGLPQGSPISPLLANLYLDRADEALQTRGLRLVRFADDFVVLARDRGGAEAARTLAARVLGELGLTLNAEKTRVVSFDQGFKFLGHLFVRSLVLKSGPIESDVASIDEALELLARNDAADETRRIADEVQEETRRQAGLAAPFRVLYLRSADRRVGLRNTAFSVQEAIGIASAVEWREILAIPHQDVDRIEIYPEAEISSEALRHAMAQGVQVAFVNGRGETLGVAQAGLDTRGGRQLAQASTALDLAKRLDLASRLIDGRLRNQRAVLRRLGRHRSEARDLDALEGLNQLIRKAPGATSVAELMGWEGRAAALYWPALGGCLEHGFRLRTRDRAPPPDPVNLVLNFTCGLLARDIGVAIARAGLHPGFGVLHESADRRDAAVYDLMEEFRAAMTESLAVYLFNNRALSHRNFSDAPHGGLRIDREGANQVIRSYEASAERVVKHPVTGRRGSWRAMMLEQAFAYAAHVEDRATYRPFVMDY
jgi:CRISPR-associated protein Cas1